MPINFEGTDLYRRCFVGRSSVQPPTGLGVKSRYRLVADYPPIQQIKKTWVRICPGYFLNLSPNSTPKARPDFQLCSLNGTFRIEILFSGITQTAIFYRKIYFSKFKLSCSSLFQWKFYLNKGLLTVELRIKDGNLNLRKYVFRKKIAH